MRNPHLKFASIYLGTCKVSSIVIAMSTTTTVLESPGSKFRGNTSRHHTTTLSGRHLSSTSPSASSDSKMDDTTMKQESEVFSDASSEESASEDVYEGNGETQETPNGETAGSLAHEDDPYREPDNISSEPRLSSWSDLDLSVIVALVSPIGHWLTGGDHIKNIFLIVLLIFYLHQLIQGM